MGGTLAGWGCPVLGRSLGPFDFAFGEAERPFASPLWGEAFGPCARGHPSSWRRLWIGGWFLKKINDNMKNAFYLQHFEKKSLPKIKGLSIGHYIKVGFLFKEGGKKRIQFFEGIVIAINGDDIEKKITLRKPGLYGMERIFSCKSPHIQNIKILQSQNFCRSKLFFLRKRIGKAAFGITRKNISRNNITAS